MSTIDYVIAFRSHRNGDLLCPDCAAIEADTEGVDHDELVLDEDPDWAPSRCDHCGGRLDQS